MPARSPIIALIVAAGAGTRAGLGGPKQYAKVGGKPVLRHAAERLLAHPAVDAVHVVIAPGQEAMFADAVAGLDLGEPIVGAPTRQGSVRAGLEAIARDGAEGAVLIHDAARPFCPTDVVDRLLVALDTHEGAVPVLPMADTVARADGELMGEDVPRGDLLRVQTPQAFRLADILRAHRDASDAEATDDAGLARAAGLRVAWVPGDERLFKLTYSYDFTRAEGFLGARLVSRTGMGFDVHAFSGPGPLIVGGITIPHDRGLTGHSDADVALHALTDALLGTIADGDIGMHFPPSDERWRGAASYLFLEHARDLVSARGGIIDHVDVTVICEAPKIGPHRDAMREAIAGMLRLPVSRVSVKATTTERLGFTGRGEGIAAQAVATVRMEDRS